jgi:hypothetical protein
LGHLYLCHQQQQQRSTHSLPLCLCQQLVHRKQRRLLRHSTLLLKLQPVMLVQRLVMLLVWLRQQQLQQQQQPQQQQPQQRLQAMGCQSALHLLLGWQGQSALLLATLLKMALQQQQQPWRRLEV